LNADCEGYVVIGRRDADRTELEQQRLADFRRQRIEIASYDRLVHQAKGHLEHVNHGWERASESAEKIKDVGAVKPADVS
jgi:hypothetical protein